jgi:hypothetical protein
MKDLKCMSFTSKGTAEVILAGLQDVMLVVDLNKGEVTKQVGCERLAESTPAHPVQDTHRTPLYHHASREIHLRRNEDRVRAPTRSDQLRSG